MCVSFGVDGCFFVFFVFKQKTAYEMRISDWSSDVCSSDLSIRAPAFPASLSGTPDQVGDYPRDIRSPPSSLRGASRRSNLQPSTRWDACWRLLRSEIGRASCRERVCQYV